jgi:rare lipoprotein A
MTKRQDAAHQRVPLYRCISLAVLSSLLVVLFLTTGCSAHKKPAAPAANPSAIGRGVASWYGPNFDGRRTANGERYDMHEMTAAHPTLPFGTMVEVRNVSNGRSAVVRINDRGPYKKSRVIDLSYAAARAIGAVLPGTATVEIFLVNSLAGGSSAPPRYTVQVGAFGDAERAASMQQDLARIYPETTVHADGTWNRVQVGLFADRQQAETVRRELAAMGMASLVVAAQ